MARNLDKIIVVDLEATCWDGDSIQPEGEVSEIIEIGITELDAKSGELIQSEGILVRPQFSTVSKFCTELTTLTAEQISKGMSYPEALEYIKSKYKPFDRTWASYGDYDREQFRRNDELYKTKSPFGRTHINVKNLLALEKGLKKEVGLTRGCELCGFTLDGTLHRGVDDSINIAKILREILCLKKQSE